MAGYAAFGTSMTSYPRLLRRWTSLVVERLRAIMAVAHKLLIAAFHMLSTGEAFRDLGESYLDQVARKRSTTKLVQRLSNLGYDVMLVPKAA